MSRRAPSAPPPIDGFTFREYLGGGGFADVFLYQQHRPERLVAVKVLLRGLGPAAQAGFDSEANLMAHLSNHPAIVSIHEVGVARDGRPFIVMENCQRQHLGERLRQRPSSVANALDLAIQIAGAVETAHRNGIVHRDIKPANILFTAYNNPVLTDFGISVSTVTGQGSTTGLSIAWAAPEQIQTGSGSDSITPASDVFSLAATLYTVLAGRSPFEQPGKNNPVEVARRVVSQTLPATGREDVPPALERVLGTAMAKSPAQRYPSAVEFARALQQVQSELRLSVTDVALLDDDVGVAELEQTPELATRIVRVLDPHGPPRAADPAGHPPAGPPPGRSSSPDRAAAERNERGEDATRAGDQNPATARRLASPRLRRRDFTGPDVMLPAGNTVIPENAPADPFAPQPAAACDGTDGARRPGRPAGRLAIAAALLIGVGLIVVLIANLLTGGGATAAESSPTTAPAPLDPVEGMVPQVEELRGTRQGDQVVFTWTNPDPRDGDYFQFRRQLLSETPEEWQDLDRPTVSVPVTPPKTCIDVTIVRSGEAGRPARKCESI